MLIKSFTSNSPFWKIGLYLSFPTQLSYYKKAQYWLSYASKGILKALIKTYSFNGFNSHPKGALAKYFITLHEGPEVKPVGLPRFDLQYIAIVEFGVIIYQIYC